MGGVVNTKRMFVSCLSKFENQALAGFEFEVGGEIKITVRQDVLHLGSTTDHLGITGHVEGGGFAGAIEDGERRTTPILTGNDIDAIIRNKLDLLTLGDDLISLSPMEQTTEPLEHRLFCL